MTKTIARDRRTLSKADRDARRTMRRLRREKNKESERKKLKKCAQTKPGNPSRRLHPLSTEDKIQRKWRRRFKILSDVSLGVVLLSILCILIFVIKIDLSFTTV
eukprot:105287_1